MAGNNGFHVEDVASILDGKQAIHAPKTQKRGPVARIANNMGKRAVNAARAELMRSTLHKLFVLLYDESADGVLLNLDFDCRINRQLVAMPWSNVGYKQWGLSRTHARVLRHAMVSRANAPVYFSGDRSWYLDNDRYPTIDHALGWLESIKLDAELWQKLIDEWRKGAV